MNRLLRAMIPAALVLGLAPGAWAQKPVGPPGTVFWKSLGAYVVHLSPPAPIEGRVFESPDFQRLLVVLQKTDKCYQLELKTRTLSTVSTLLIVPHPEGLFLPATAPAAPAGSFTRNGANMAFKTPNMNLNVELVLEPPLVGEVTLDTLFARRSDYQAGAEAYQPDPAAIARLKAWKKPVEIAAFFGTWCPHCHKWMPQFIKVMELAHNPAFTVHYFAVSEDFKKPHDLIWSYNAHVTPTIIVRDRGTEVGRIKSKPRVSMEQDLVDILGGMK